MEEVEKRYRIPSIECATVLLVKALREKGFVCDEMPGTPFYNIYANRESVERLGSIHGNFDKYSRLYTVISVNLTTEEGRTLDNLLAELKLE